MADAVDANVMSVAVAPCRDASRFASSASGIRCPIPGVASIATCGPRTEPAAPAGLLPLQQLAAVEPLLLLFSILGGAGAAVTAVRCGGLFSGWC